MAVRTNSRHAQNGRILLVPDEDSGRDRRFLFTRRQFTLDDIGTRHTVHSIQLGDRLDTLADKFGGDARKWWLIADINDIVGFPLDLEPGVQLIIPFREIFDTVG